MPPSPVKARRLERDPDFSLPACHPRDPRLPLPAHRRVDVVETFEGDTVWEGEVLVFDLIDHPTAQYCYAWEVDGQVTSVLHTGPIDSPVKAVRASILAD